MARYTMGAAMVFRGAAGQEIKSNWDALGMRASGSHDVVYENSFVPEDLFLTADADWGAFDELNLIIASGANFSLVCTSLGIAEPTVRDLVVDMARTRTKAPSGRPLAERRGVQHLVAEIEVDLATCRGLLDSVGRLLDEHLVRRRVPAMSPSTTCTGSTRSSSAPSWSSTARPSRSSTGRCPSRAAPAT